MQTEIIQEHEIRNVISLVVKKIAMRSKPYKALVTL